jgi:Bacterial type II secretion system protein N.
MSRRGLLWCGLVFTLTLLVELPAAWVVRGVGLSAGDVSGSVWQGQAQQLGPVGPVRWVVQPWRMQGSAQLGFQGQAWQLRAEGWPWSWRLDAIPMGAQVTVPASYRLTGQWEGALTVEGKGRECLTGEGRLTVHDLALSEPWSLSFGTGWLAVDCKNGWRLHGQLAQQGQHHLTMDADLPGRQAVVMFQLTPEAALTPLLREAQWLAPQALAGHRNVNW